MGERPWQKGSLVYDTTNAVSDKRATRTGIPRETPDGRAVFPLLVGVDGQVDGGLIPFPGFLYLHDFTASLEDDANWIPGAARANAVVKDMRAVAFSTLNGVQGAGFVYLVDTDSGASWGVSIFIDYTLDGTTWSSRHLTEFAGDADPDSFEVVVQTNLVYVFYKGKRPILFYLVDASTERQIGGAAATTPGSNVGAGPQVKFPDEGQYVAIPTSSMLSGGATARAVVQMRADTTGITGGQAVADVHLLEPGGYKFAVQFYDSATGRRSSISEIAVANTADFPGSPSAAYARLELAWDSAVWDRVNIYRSVRKESVGGEYSGVFLHLDRTVTLTTIQNQQDGITTVWRGYYFYELEDQVLVRKEVWLESDEHEQKVPPGGSAGVYDGALFVGDTAQVGGESADSRYGKGELWWSSLLEGSIELFRPNSKIAPRTLADRFVAFETAGEELVAWSHNGLLMVHRENLFFRFSPMHDGWGILNKRAKAKVGNQVYYANNKGVKVVTSDGVLEDLKVLNQVVARDWAGQYADIHMAYDAYLGAVVVLNSNSGVRKAELLWLNTGRLTSLDDCNFKTVTPGKWWRNPVTPGSTPFMDRAFWLDEFNRVWVVDVDRLSGGDSFLDVGTGALRFPVVSASPTTATVTGTVPPRAKGAYLYILESADESKIGTRLLITNVSGNVLIFTGSPAPAVGDRVGLSPIKVEVMCPAMDENMFSVKQVQSASCSFTKVSGAAVGSTDAKFRMSVYEGDEAAAVVRGVAVNQKGVKVESVKAGPSVYEATARDTAAPAALRSRAGASDLAQPFVSIETFCPELLYTLLGIKVTGTITESDRKEVPT